MAIKKQFIQDYKNFFLIRFAKFCMTDKLYRTASRQVWRCTVCQFDNSILLENCEMCDSKRPQKFISYFTQQKIQDLSTSVPVSKVLICLDPKCKTQNDIHEIQCKKCKKILVEGLDDDSDEELFDGQKKEKKSQKIACHKCSQENDDTRLKCAKCNIKLKTRKIPKVRASKPMKPVRFGPNYCPQCKSYKLYTLMGHFECQCPDPEDLLPVNKSFCNFCFQSLKQGQYEDHIKGCEDRQKFYDHKSKSYERCSKLQIDTMMYMQKKCEQLHFRKQRKLENRIIKLGYPLKDLENLYFYIVNLAPIIIHMHADKHFTFYVKDTHYRNQFQTAKSSGSLSSSSRIAWEDRMFDHLHHNASPFERVKYGTMNFTNDPHGVAVCSGYGQSYFLLKEHVRNRCTMTDMDSSASNATICTFRFCYHLLSKLTDNQIRAAFEGSKAQQIKSAGIIGAYKEIQIHGPVEFNKDIERVYIHRAEVAMNPKCMDEIKQFCKNNELEYEEFGEVPKPIDPMGGGLFGGGMFGVGGAFPASGFGVPFGGGFIGGPMYKKPKKTPIKYAPVSFPYSRPEGQKKEKEEQDYI